MLFRQSLKISPIVHFFLHVQFSGDIQISTIAFSNLLYEIDYFAKNPSVSEQTVKRGDISYSSVVQSYPLS